MIFPYRRYLYFVLILNNHLYIEINFIKTNLNEYLREY